jgi:hypothetical protein
MSCCFLSDLTHAYIDELLLAFTPLRKAEGGEDLQPSKGRRTQIKLEVAEGAAEAMQRPKLKRKDAERSAEAMPRPFVKPKLAAMQRQNVNSKENDTTRKIVEVFCDGGPTIEKVKSIR